MVLAFRPAGGANRNAFLVGNLGLQKTFFISLAVSLTLALPWTTSFTKPPGISPLWAKKYATSNHNALTTPLWQLDFEFWRTRAFKQKPGTI